MVEIALNYPELSSRELAHKITDEKGVFISESSVYRILKKRGLITAPSHILISASNEFKDKTNFVHEMWQTDFTYFKILGWGWYYLSTVIDDFMCVPSFHKVGFDYSKKSWKKAAEVLESSITTIMQASEEFKVGDHEKVKETIKKVQKNKRAIKNALSNVKPTKTATEKIEAPVNAIILKTGDWFIIVDPIIDKLGENEKNKPWIYHFRKESKELAIIINEESPIHRNLISGKTC